MTEADVNPFAAKEAPVNWKALSKVALAWQVSNKTGWGIHGYYLAKRMMERRLAWPVVGEDTDLKPDDLIALPGPLCFGPLKATQLAFTIFAGGNGVGSIIHADAVTKGDGLIHVFEDPSFSTRDKEVLARFEDKVITVSEWNVEVLRQAGFRDARCVHLGVDTKMFRPRKKGKRFGDGRFVIFSGGKLELRKGQDIVIEAFKRFAEKHPEALLVTMWHNHWPQTTESLRESPYVKSPVDFSPLGGISNWVADQGVRLEQHEELGIIGREDLAALMASFDVAVFPNRCEGGTNMVAMECLASGVPTILSANSGHSDLIRYPIPHFALERNNPCMLRSANEFWREADPEELAEGLEHIFSNPVEARLCASLAAERMQDKFDWSVRMDDQISALRIGQDEKALQRAIAATKHTINNLPKAASQAALGLSHFATQLIDARQNESSLASARRALADADSDPRLLGNYSKILLQLHKPQEARTVAERALAYTSDPAQKTILTKHVGLSYYYSGQIENGLKEFDRVRAHDTEAAYTYSLGLLMLGRWREGFAEFEGRRRTHPDEHSNRLVPEWDGKTKVERLWITSEQGFGDMFMTARFLPWARSMCSRLIFSAHPQLMPLFYGYPGVDELRYYDSRVPDPEADAHAPIQSLMHFSGLEPNKVPPDPGHFKKIATGIQANMRAPTGCVLKVGLCWAGSPLHQRDYERSMRLEELLPLTENAQIQFYSLQVGDRSKDVEAIGAQGLVGDITDKLPTWHATMGALKELDVLVTVDTALAHMAGCLGTPTFLLLCKFADWRWARGRDDTPWYPSLKLFRQKRLGQWAEPVEEIAKRLKVLCAKKAAPAG